MFAVSQINKKQINREMAHNLAFKLDLSIIMIKSLSVSQFCNNNAGTLATSINFILSA